MNIVSPSNGSTFSIETLIKCPKSERSVCTLVCHTLL